MSANRLIAWIKHTVKHSARAKGAIKYLATQPLFSNLYNYLYRNKITSTLASIKFPCTLSIEVTNACNAKCIMCPRDKMTRPIGFMPDDLFRKIVDNAAKAGVRRIQLMHYGEPLMDKALPSKIKYVKEKGIEVGIFTNGALLSAERGEGIIRAGLDEICFSFDAFSRETYARIRRGLDFDKVQANIMDFISLKKRLAAGNPRIKIIFVASAENSNEALAFRKKWEALVDEVETTTVDNYAGAIDIKPAKQKLKFIERQKKMFPCPQLWKHFVVLWDGRVALCCKDYNGDVVLGDVKLDSLQDIWDGIKARLFRDAHLKGAFHSLPLCKDCSMHKISHLFAWWTD